MNTLKESRTQEDNIMLMLGRLEGKVDALLAAKVSIEEKVSEIEKRLQGLEHRLAYWAGSIGVGSGLLLGTFEWFRH